MEEHITLLEAWLRSLLWEKTLPTPLLHSESNHGDAEFNIHRTKGLFKVANKSWRVIQGVREVFEIREIEPFSSPEENNQNTGKIVFIGQGLDQEMFQRSLNYVFHNSSFE